jgi:RNA polymerase sigma-70 factor (ECF subfamily)
MSNLTGAAEAVVVALATAGDETAFEELVRRKQSSVRSLMRYLSRDANIAEDLAQQVFVEMWKSLRRLQTTAAFSGWLRRIAVNVWLQHARKTDTTLRGLSDPLDETAMDAIEHPMHGRPDHLRMNIDLASALALLPAPARLCIVLAYQEGLSHGDIVTMTGIPLGTVKSHITRGCVRLRALLREYGPES